MNCTIEPTIWNDCYESSWKGVITPESFSHPAKYSRDLIERIFQHCLEKCYLRKGDLVGDCFGGIGTGGIAATYAGLRWVGVELEPRFVKLAEANFELHASRFRSLNRTPPYIVKGDSRKFDEIISEADGVVCSPPYAVINVGAGGLNHKPAKKPGQQTGRSSTSASQVADPHYGGAEGQISNLKEGSVDGVVTSPPFIQTQGGGGKGINRDGYEANGRKDPRVGVRAFQGDAGDREANNIEMLPAGQLDAVVSSPPYADSVNSTQHGIDFTKAKKDYPGRVMHEQRVALADKRHSEQSYGKTDGQIGALHAGPVDAVITSPPFADSIRGMATCQTDVDKSDRKCGPNSQQALRNDYGSEAGQIGRLKSEPLDAVVTSPPWEKNSEGGRAAGKFKSPAAAFKSKRGHGASDAAVLAQAARDEKKTYGDSLGQIGQEKAETYWSAMHQVYAACFRAIRPGGVLVAVLKDYVKGGKRVPLCDDTARLLEHCGFTVIERIHAMLVKVTEHNDLFNGATRTKKSRKSFFRRLAEKNGSPEINFEEIIIAKKP